VTQGTRSDGKTRLKVVKATLRGRSLSFKTAGLFHFNDCERNAIVPFAHQWTTDLFIRNCSHMWHSVQPRKGVHERCKGKGKLSNRICAIWKVPRGKLVFMEVLLNVFLKVFKFGSVVLCAK